MLIYRKAGSEDLEELVRTRILVLRAANQLPEDTPMPEVEEKSRAYYSRALETGDHTAYLVYDGSSFVGTGGISYYRVLPTCCNPSGEKAYIMNMYTAPAYRRQGIASETLRLLAADARSRGITAISLEATRAGRPLYEKFGFAPMTAEMELPQSITAFCHRK